MTAILDELRRLDQELSRGELTRDEYSDRRESILHAVEDAQTEFDLQPNVRTAAPETTGMGAIGFSIAICLGTMTVSTGLILLFLPDLNLALTVGVTILAVLVVGLLRHSDE